MVGDIFAREVRDKSSVGDGRWSLWSCSFFALPMLFSLFSFFPCLFQLFSFLLFFNSPRRKSCFGIYFFLYFLCLFFFNVSVQVLVTSQKLISKYSIPFISLLCRNFYIRLCVRILCKCTCVCMSVLHVVNIQRGCALLLAGYHSLWPCLEKLD